MKNDLCNTRGDGLSISDFVDKINHIADNLALAGKPIDDDELVTAIMNNIGSAYEIIISSAQARDTLISYDDLVALLLSAKIRLQKQQTPLLGNTPTVMYTPKSNNQTTRGRGSLHN